MNREDLLTEEKIFTAATEEFEQKGMDGARMQDIADRAGINKALLHYYFRTKDKLFEAVFDKLSEKMFMKFIGILEMDMPLDKKIEFFITEHITFLEKNSRLPLFILRETSRNPDLLKKFLNKINLDRIKEGLGIDLDKESNADNHIAHLMVSIISLSIFPIVAKPIIEGILNKQNIDYAEFIEERKVFTPRFINGAIESMKI